MRALTQHKHQGTSPTGILRNHRVEPDCFEERLCVQLWRLSPCSRATPYPVSGSPLQSGVRPRSCPPLAGTACMDWQAAWRRGRHTVFLAMWEAAGNRGTWRHTRGPLQQKAESALVAFRRRRFLQRWHLQRKEGEVGVQDSDGSPRLSADATRALVQAVHARQSQGYLSASLVPVGKLLPRASVRALPQTARFSSISSRVSKVALPQEAHCACKELGGGPQGFPSCSMKATSLSTAGARWHPSDDCSGLCGAREYLWPGQACRVAPLAAGAMRDALSHLPAARSRHRHVKTSCWDRSTRACAPVDRKAPTWLGSVSCRGRTAVRQRTCPAEVRQNFLMPPKRGFRAGHIFGIPLSIR